MEPKTQEPDKTMNLGNAKEWIEKNSDELRTFLQLTGLASLAMAALASLAMGATYNFYFNNTEQGDNSTANPSLSVVDGKGAKSGGTEPLPEVMAQPSHPPTPPAAPPATETLTGPPPVAAAPEQSTLMAKVESLLGQPEFHKTRFTVGAGLHPDHDVMLTANAGYFVSREIGFNAFGGVGSKRRRSEFNGGAELEVVPFRVSLGRIENIVDVGFMVGASTSRPASGNWVSPHLGARVNFNVGSRWSLTVAGRGNLGYGSGEAALAIRL